MALGALPNPSSAHLSPPEPAASLNPGSLSLLFSLAAALALATFLLTTRLVFPPPKRTLTLTELNTLLNRHENGGTGVWARKWRKRFLAPPTFGDEDVLADAGIDECKGGETDAWRIRSRPPPQGLRGCLKRAVDMARDAAVDVPDPALVVSEAAADPPRPPRRRTKQVRVVEPSLDDLEVLRTRWASPGMQGEHGSGGIGGFRSTRDFYVRGKGGMGVVQKAVGAAEKKLEPGKATSATRADDDDEVVEEGDGQGVLLRRSLRPPRLSAVPAPNRTTSTSPSPVGRRRRALSPTSPNPAHRSLSPAFIVGTNSSTAKSSPSRRRALSPTHPATGRAHSASPGPPAERAVPRWVKTRSGKLASPAPVRMAMSPDSAEESTVDEDEGESVSEEHVSTGRPPASPPTPVVGIAALAAVLAPLSSDASIAVSPVSPSFSVLSGGESPQESPTPAPTRLPHQPPKLAVTPSSAPSRQTPGNALAPLATSAPVAPMFAPSSAPSPASPIPSSLVTLSSVSDTTSTSPSTVSSASPSPTVGAERRHSLRVSRALRDKQGKRRALPDSGSAIAA
ncbi:hypothetical protein JCM3770_007342 [Rhodotorula araucariae]